jgi:O-succinylbenzoate synthase
MKIVACELYLYDAELRYPMPRKSNLIRSGLYVRMLADAGFVSFGEIAPLEGFSSETLDEAIEQSHRYAPLFTGLPVNADAIRTVFSGGGGGGGVAYPSVLCGFELALAAMISGSLNPASVDNRAVAGPVWSTMSRRSRVELCALLSGSYNDVLNQARASVSAGFQTYKLKVGSDDLDRDVALIGELRNVIGPTANVRIDANRAWTVTSAVHVLERTREVGFEYVEEPLQDSKDLPDLLSALSVPVALDESTDEVLTRAGAISDVSGLTALILKPMMRRGYQGSFDLAREALGSGVNCVVSSSFESRIGLGGLFTLAAGLPGDGLAAGLDTGHYFSVESESRLSSVTATSLRIDQTLPEGIFIKRIL